MKVLILGLFLSATPAFAATSELHDYDAKAFILNHLELPAVGTVGNFERSKNFTDVSITAIVDKNGWGYLNFKSNQGNFRVERAADVGLFEELVNTPQVKSGYAKSVWVGCRYTLGQKEKNWFSPFVTSCKFSF